MKTVLVILIAAFNNFGAGVKTDQIIFSSRAACEEASNVVNGMTFNSYKGERVVVTARCVEDK